MNWRLGTSYIQEDWNDWDFWRKMGPEIDKAFWGLFELMSETYLRRAIPPTDPFAPAVVKWLLKRGHEVHLVTSNDNSPKAIESFKGWLWAQGIEMLVVALGTQGPHNKAKLDYEVFIDDSPKLARDMANEPEKTLILYRRPLNDAVLKSGVSGNVLPANDWLEIKSILESIGA